MTGERKSTQDHLNEQRAEAEVKDILKDLENLRSFTAEQKNRWIWELVQNAHDEATEHGVNITVTISEKEVCFEHDGRPFTVPNLLAITRRTSTKSLEGEDGNAGKFGTGFVTTHVLNSRVELSGVLKNDEGERPFTDYLLDRSATGFDALSAALNSAFKEIDLLDLLPAVSIENNCTRYRYALNERTYKIAEGGLEQLENNLAFTLLVNWKRINSIAIYRPQKAHSYSLVRTETKLENLRFTQLKFDNDETGEHEKGLLYMEHGNVVLGLPVSRYEGTYTIHPLGDAARIYRSFPLIGTEAFHLPFLLHSEHFEPSQYRDGVRTQKATEAEADPKADVNRAVLVAYVEAACAFFRVITMATDFTFDGLHRLAESGLPEDPANYLGSEWYTEHIQQPYRQHVLKAALVNTVSGTPVRLQEACFIEELEDAHTVHFYRLVAAFYPATCPSEATYRHWLEVVAQEPEEWPGVTRLTIQDFVRKVSENKQLDALPFETPEKSIQFLDDLLDFLEATGKMQFAEDHPICPNVKGDFQPLQLLEKETGLQPELKPIAKAWGDDLDETLLHPDMKQRERFTEFSISDFYRKLNTDIGNSDMPPSDSTQIKAAFDLACSAKPTRAPKREEWFSIMHDLLPDLAPKRTEVEYMNDYTWDPVDKWTLRYVSYKVQEAQTLGELAKQYFEEDEIKAIEWLNRLIAFIEDTREEARDAALKYDIFPMQDGSFYAKQDSLVREEPPHSFPDLLKTIRRDWITNLPDPKIRLLDNRIKTKSIGTATLKWLADPIDDLFEKNDAERRVEEDDDFKAMFHQLNKLYNEDEHVAAMLVLFGKRRAFLQMKALGEDVDKVLPLLERPADEVKALAELPLTAIQLNVLKQAADSVGAEKLLEKARELMQAAEDIRWRQKVGAAAEEAFKEAMGEAAPQFIILNPDDGKDFVLTYNGKSYSLEVKSTVIGNETVKMSMKQGQTASDECDHYALCVINRISGTLVTKEQFIADATFVCDIGEQVGSKVSDWRNGVNALNLQEEVRVKLEDHRAMVYVNRPIWKKGISFLDFVERLRLFFK